MWKGITECRTIRFVPSLVMWHYCTFNHMTAAHTVPVSIGPTCKGVSWWFSRRHILPLGPSAAASGPSNRRRSFVSSSWRLIWANGGWLGLCNTQQQGRHQ